MVPKSWIKYSLSFWIILTLSVSPSFAQTDDRVGKILLGSHIGDATIISVENEGSDKPTVRFKRMIDDITETCARELGSTNDPKASKAVADCVKSNVKSPNPVLIRRAWCSRSTLYTEFGNFSMIGFEKEPPTQFKGETYYTLRTIWKDHKNDQLIGNCGGCNTPQLIDTFRILCPNEYRILFGSYSPY